MKKDVEDIQKVFDLLTTACLNIQGNDRCLDCPVKHYCLDGVYGTPTLTELEASITKSTWKDFLEFADKCLPSAAMMEDMRYAELAEKGRYDF